MSPNLEPKIMEVAERLTSLRDIAGYTQEEVAEAVGVPLETYKNYEAGKLDFGFTFLYKCAECFGVDMIEILTGENPHLTGYSVVRGGRGLPIKRREGFEYYHLASRFRNKLAEPFLVKAPYNAEAQGKPIELNRHDGQEFDMVISGRLRFVFEGHIEELEAGDSVYYNSGRDHGMIATGGEDCSFLAVVLKDPNEGVQ